MHLQSACAIAQGRLITLMTAFEGTFMSVLLRWRCTAQRLKRSRDSRMASPEAGFADATADSRKNVTPRH